MGLRILVWAPKRAVKKVINRKRVWERKKREKEFVFEHVISFTPISLDRSNSQHSGIRADIY